MLVSCEFIQKWVLDTHADNHDTSFVGQIAVNALGIDAPCALFAKSERFPDTYNVGWEKNGAFKMEIVPVEKLLPAIRKYKYRRTER